ncbi:Transposase for insertion sequence element ISRM5 [Bienertia sinuspersici]
MDRMKQCKSNWMAEQLLDVFEARPHWPAKEIIDCIRLGFKVVVKKQFAYKVKYKAHKLLHGSMKQHYAKLGSYIAALKDASPASDVKLVTYLRRDIGSQCSKGCTCVLRLLRRVGLKDLMVAIGRDGNEQMFPIAWAGRRRGVFVSDEHQAILSGIASVFPSAEHRHCARHIFANWHKHHKGDEMKLAFWKIAQSYNLADMNDAYDELEKADEAAALSFKRYNPKCFCRAYMSTSCKADVITSNLAETFNGYIIHARNKHLVDMMEDITAQLMQRLVVKRKEMQQHTGLLCPRIQERLEKEKHEAAKCRVIPSSDTLFEVGYYLDTLTVDLDARKCTCRKWDLNGIPCCHAIACIFFCHGNAEDYVHESYTREMYLKTYSGTIPPLEGERHWPTVNMPIDPPPIKVGPGRPRKNRVKDPHENPKKQGKLTRHGIEMTCSSCQRKGHNKRICPNKGSTSALPPPQPKRKRGRPKSTGEASISTVHMHESQGHHDNTVEPGRIGKGGKVAYTGRGRGRGADAGSIQASTSGKGRGRGRGKGRGRGNGPCQDNQLQDHQVRATSMSAKVDQTRSLEAKTAPSSLPNKIVVIN